MHDNPIRHVIAVDGGYTEVVVQPEFPSATVCFFQFGALIFELADLAALDELPFIDPDDIARLKRIQRLELVLPVRNVALTSESTLTHSVRRALYEFFCTRPEDSSLMETLRWLLFEEYANPRAEWLLASCPFCETGPIPIARANLSAEFTVACTRCGSTLFLTDVLRLHEAIDDELGAGGILAYVVTAIEQLLVADLIRIILKTKPALLHEILFVKDGPLAFFGQTANLHKPMRALVAHLLDQHDLFLVGLEKSGAFVEHADEIADRIAPGCILLLDNEYIYRNVLPGRPDAAEPYGRTTYFGNKLIFKTTSGATHVVSLPTREVLTSPRPADLPNMDIVLTCVEALRCDMYDNALVPVALANKLVSLANHPSAKILQKLATSTLGA